MKERGWGALQNLPSTVAALVLDARPGMRVLDMCAAPGGKTCAIADAMCNHGSILAFDRSADKSLLVADMARQYGHDCIVQACRRDSTELVQVSDAVKAKFTWKVCLQPGFAESSAFSHIPGYPPVPGGRNIGVDCCMYQSVKV